MYVCVIAYIWNFWDFSLSKKNIRPYIRFYSRWKFAMQMQTLRNRFSKYVTLLVSLAISAKRDTRGWWVNGAQYPAWMSAVTRKKLKQLTPYFVEEIGGGSLQSPEKDYVGQSDKIVQVTKGIAHLSSTRRHNWTCLNVVYSPLFLSLSLLLSVFLSLNIEEKKVTQQFLGDWKMNCTSTCRAVIECNWKRENSFPRLVMYVQRARPAIMPEYPHRIGPQKVA